MLLLPDGLLPLLRFSLLFLMLLSLRLLLLSPLLRRPRALLPSPLGPACKPRDGDAVCSSYVLLVTNQLLTANSSQCQQT